MEGDWMTARTICSRSSRSRWACLSQSRRSPLQNIHPPALAADCRRHRICFAPACRLHSHTVQHHCNRSGILRLLHAGADLPQGTRLRICQHHVHRQSAQRNREPVHLPARQTAGGAAQGAALLRHHLRFCARCRCRRHLLAAHRLRAIWISSLLLCIAFGMMQKERR